MSERSDSYEGGAAQLRLLLGGERHDDWRLDERTRRVGKKGVAAAREVLRRAQPPEPVQKSPTRKAS
jgi:hypothetical protein